MFQTKIMLPLFILFFLFPAFGEKSSDVVIVNTNTNKAAAKAPSQTVIAPALNPSKAKKLRDARESAEVQTESLILEQVEKERLKSEQSLLNKIFSSSQQKPSTSGSAATPQPAPSPYAPPGMDRVYISPGVGMVRLLGATNVGCSDSTPFCLSSYFLSIGGSAKKYILFDLGFIYSRHYVRPTEDDIHLYPDTDSRIRVDQPMVTASIRFSPFSTKIRPYGGLSIAAIGRRMNTVNKDGDAIDWEWEEETRDVAEKEWTTSFDGGINGGIDVDLGSSVGLNVDLRYHWNLYTEDSIDKHAWDMYNRKKKLLSEAESFIFSVNLKFYF